VEGRLVVVEEILNELDLLGLFFVPISQAIVATLQTEQNLVLHLVRGHLALNHGLNGSVFLLHRSVLLLLSEQLVAVNLRCLVLVVKPEHLL
jgi:hypothetical protein